MRTYYKHGSIFASHQTPKPYASEEAKLVFTGLCYNPCMLSVNNVLVSTYLKQTDVCSVIVTRTDLVSFNNSVFIYSVAYKVYTKYEVVTRY